MTSLNAVNIGQNKFCGPAVLSILTGRNTDDCAYAITKVNGNYNIKGVTIVDLLKAAGNLGFESQKIDCIDLSLFRTLHKISSYDGVYIIMVPNHFVVVEVKDHKLYFCDNHTKEPISAGSSARLSQRVLDIYKVSKKPKPSKIEASYRDYIIKKKVCNHCNNMADAEDLIVHRATCPYILGL